MTGETLPDILITDRLQEVFCNTKVADEYDTSIILIRQLSRVKDLKAYLYDFYPDNYLNSIKTTIQVDQMIRHLNDNCLPFLGCIRSSALVKELSEMGYSHLVLAKVNAYLHAINNRIITRLKVDYIRYNFV